MLCADVVKFGRQEIGKIVRCLPDKKKTNLPLFHSRYCADRAQNLPGPSPDNTVRVLHISSKLVHCWWFVSDIAIFVLKRDVKLQLTNSLLVEL